MSQSPQPRERLPGLDVLRGLAALAVVGFHYTTRFGTIFGHPTPPLFSMPWGQRGVEVFFVISGFAIELSLQHASTARDFLVSRGVRLYPTFWAALAVTFLVVRAFGLPDRAISTNEALVNTTMIPVSLGVPAADAVYWTLERELRFYALVVLLLALGLRRYTAHALVGAVALQVVAYRSSIVPHWLADATNVGWAHLFACGALLCRHRTTPSWKTAAWIAACVASSRTVGLLPLVYGAGAVGFTWLAARVPSQTPLRPLVWLGAVSYPLYLVHQYVGYVVLRGLYARGVGTSAAILSTVVVAVGLAAALHWAVERPCLRILRRRRALEVPLERAEPQIRVRSRPVLDCSRAR